MMSQSEKEAIFEEMLNALKGINATDGEMDLMKKVCVLDDLIERAEKFL